MKTPTRTSFLRPIVIAAVCVAIDLTTSSGTELPPTTDGPAERLLSFVETSGRLEGADFKVEINDHIAHLRGTTRTLDQAEYIAAATMRMDEVFGVVQGLHVRGPVGKAEPTAREMMARSPALANTSLDVRISPDGSAVIAGKVGCFDEGEIARELVSRVAGIREIEVRVLHDPFRLRPAGAIEAQLLMNYADDPIFARYGLVPRFSNGVLTIDGSVASPEEKDRLLLHSLVSGVMECNTRGIAIDAGLALAGIGAKEYQTSDILKVFDLVTEADPRLHGSHLVAGFVGSRLTIDGHVPTRAAREACLANARALPGVSGIDARIRVAADGPSLSVN